MLESFKWRLLSGSSLWAMFTFLAVVLIGTGVGITAANATTRTTSTRLVVTNLCAPLPPEYCVL